MPAPFRYRRMVEFADTDMAGIMHFSAFFRFMEGAEHALIRHVGLSVYHRPEELADGQSPLSFPRVSSRCDFHRPARCEDRLDVEVTVHRLGNKSITYGFLFKHEEEELAVGEMTSVCCLMHAGAPPEPIELPQIVRDALKPHVSGTA